MTSHKLKNNLLIICSSLLILIIISSVIFLQILQSDHQIIDFEDRRYRFSVLSDELRQTIDDLTRMSRLYVVTRDTKYREYFQTILDIKDGIRPRPEDYHNIYWDFYVATGEPPRKNSHPIDLQTLIQQESLTQKEMFFFQEAEVATKNLIQLQEQAMNIMIGFVATDDDGRYTLNIADPVKARQILHGDKYNQIKQKAMQFLNTFFELVNTRFSDTLNKHKTTRKKLYTSLTITLGVIFCLVIISFLLIIFSPQLQQIQRVTQHKLPVSRFFSTYFFRHWPLIAGATVTILLTVSISWWSFNQNRILIYDNLNSHLDQILQAGHNTVLDWINRTKIEASFIANEISYHVSEEDFQNTQGDTSNKFQEEFSASRILESEISEKYIITNAGGFIVASDDESLIGKLFQIPSFMQRQINHAPYQTVYFVSQDDTLASLLPTKTIIFGTRISEEKGAVYLLLDGEEILSRLLKRHFFYNTDEIYIANTKGEFISQSRWMDELLQRGFILGDSITGLKISSDPLDDQSILSLSAQDVIAGHKGVNLSGYPNYLNDNVVGRWMWDQTYQFGVIAEWNFQEALATFISYKQTANLQNSFIVLLIFVLALFFIWKNIEVDKTNLELTDAYKTITKQNEKYVSDLQIGQKVQMDMLPEVIKGNGFAIDALLQPAQVVSGDFYDFDFIDKQDRNKIYFTIGDVSGKGVPAALFMSVTKAFLHKTLDIVHTSQDIVSNVNRELSHNNERCMFVTLIVGIMDVQTGIVQITNAGHTAPYIKKRTGEVVCLSENQGPLVGTFKDAKYDVQSIKMSKGDILLFYTDGVTEAQNENKEFYEEYRMRDFLEHNTFTSPKYLTKALSQHVTSFIGSSQQFDDITILSLSYLG